MLWRITDISWQESSTVFRMSGLQNTAQQARTIAVSRLPERKVLLTGYVQVHIGKLILVVRERTQRFKNACCLVMRTRLWIPGPM